MKIKLFIFFMFLVAVFTINSQEKCKFFVNNGSLEVQNVKCGEFKDLKVNVPLMANAVNYDAVTIYIRLNEVQDFLGYSRYLKNEIKNIAGKTNIFWVINPGNPEGNGDFSYGNDQAKNITYYFNNKILCKIPNERKLKEVTLEVKALGFTITGTKKVFSKADNAYYNENVYNDGTVLSIGTIKIIQAALSASYTDPNGIIKVNLINPDTAFPQVFNKVNDFNMNYELVEVAYAKPDDIKNHFSTQTAIKFLIIKEEEFDKIGKFKEIKLKAADYTAYDFIKDDIENSLKYETYPDESNFKKPAAALKFKPSHQWIQQYIGVEWYISAEVKAKNIVNMLTSGKKGDTIWVKKKAGNYEYDNISFDKVYYEVGNTKNSRPLHIYVIYRKPYVIVIGLFGRDAGKSYAFYDPETQISYFNKTLENMEFLK